MAMIATPDPAARRTLCVMLTTFAALVSIVALTPRVDEVGEVDAVVVLGGGGGERVELGERLAREHGVPMVVYAEGIARARASGLRCEHDLTCVWPTPSRTDGEARTTREIAGEQGWDRVVVATSTFHVNRARTLFRHCLGDRVDVVGTRAHGDLLTQVRRFARELLAHGAAVTVRRGC